MNKKLLKLLSKFHCINTLLGCFFDVFIFVAFEISFDLTQSRIKKPKTAHESSQIKFPWNCCWQGNHRGTSTIPMPGAWAWDRSRNAAVPGTGWDAPPSSPLLSDAGFSILKGGSYFSNWVKITRMRLHHWLPGRTRSFGDFCVIRLFFLMKLF